MDYQKLILFVMLLFTLNIASYAQEMDEPIFADDEEQVLLPRVDPLEKFNRGIFLFNNKVDTIVLKPAATLYNCIIPKPLNLGIHNVFNNINNIPTIINDLLQMHIYQAVNDFWRLVINSTLGIGGLFDVACRMGLPPYSNDFGLTLATWGFKNSTFLEIPFYGPSTFRDGIEIPVDYYVFSIYPWIRKPLIRYSIYGVSVIDRRAQLLKFQPVLDEVAIDQYAFQRDAYMQRRQYQIEQNDRLGVGVKERPSPVVLEENKPSSVNIGTE